MNGWYVSSEGTHEDIVKYDIGANTGNLKTIYIQEMVKKPLPLLFAVGVQVSIDIACL